VTYHGIIRAGIIGCGAIAKLGHLPACMLVPSCRLQALVDLNPARAWELAARWSIPVAGTDYRELLSAFDLAIVATPPATHGQIVTDLLSRGIHVLCEKPMATTSADCQRMIDAADAGGAVLSVGHQRRLHPNLHMLKRLIESGSLGSVERIEIEEGRSFNWPSQSGYMFRADQCGGHLLDTGAHGLDTMIWLAGGARARLLDYKDDALGGVESNVLLSLSFDNDVEATFRLSRTRAFSNTVVVQGTIGRASASLDRPNQLTVAQVTPGGDVVRKTELLCGRHKFTLWDALTRQLEDMAMSILYGRAPRVTGADAAQVVELIERCYAQRDARPIPARAPLPGALQ
jgi:predicted dehydrogenase